MSIDRFGISLLSVAHVVNDSNQSALPAIIPWLLLHHGLSLASAATLVLAMNLSSSVVQPLFGHLSDRKSLAWVLPASILFATFGVAAIGLAPNFAWMFVGAFISGIGVAAFHPEGSRYANYFAGEKRARGMSWFTLGGYLGFAAGPIVVTPLLLLFGLRGTVALVIPGIVIAAVLLLALPRFEAARAHSHHARRIRAGSDDWKGFWMLTVVVALRSMTFLAAVTFLPIFALRVTHVERILASLLLAVMLIGGAIGTLLGGRLADHFGRRQVVAISLAGTAAAATAIALFGHFAPAFAFVLPCALAFGVSLGLSSSVVVVMGQEYLPQRIGVASGVTLGLAVTIGGLAAPFFGWLGDRDGLVAVFAAIAVFGVFSFASSAFLRLPRTDEAGVIAA